MELRSCPEIVESLVFFQKKSQCSVNSFVPLMLLDESSTPQGARRIVSWTMGIELPTLEQLRWRMNLWNVVGHGESEAVSDVEDAAVVIQFGEAAVLRQRRNIDVERRSHQGSESRVYPATKDNPWEVR